MFVLRLVGLSWLFLAVSSFPLRVHTKPSVAIPPLRVAERIFRDVAAAKIVHGRSPMPMTRSENEASEESTGKDLLQIPPPLPMFWKLLSLLFEGITLPFPALRSLMEIDHTIKTREQDAKKIKVGFSLRESFLAIVLYLSLGVVSYSSTVLQHDNSWSLVDALYFGVVTFTSVGYGDLCPMTTPGKMFTILFGLSGIALLGAAIATIGGIIIERENQMIQAAQVASRKRLIQLFHSLYVGGTNETEVGTSPTDGKDDRTTRSQTQLPLAAVGKVSLWSRTVGNWLKKSVPAIVALLVGGTLMGRIEGWTITDSVYYAFITAGTLGYGDFSPLTRRGRIWGIFFIPLAVAAAGEVLGNVATGVIERRQQQFYDYLMAQELNIDQLLKMDADKDGRVTREEYVQFMLKEMDMVPEEQFNDLHEQFLRLDLNGDGYLDTKDLTLNTAKI